MAKNNIIDVHLFGEEIGRIGLDENEGRTSFQYHPTFLASSKYLNIFPNTGILKRVPQAQVFNSFGGKTFHGLPPQFADSLPDKFGNLLFKIWLESKNENDITILEQLAYVANRGMGAIEYHPGNQLPKNASIDLEEIIDVLKSVVEDKRSHKEISLSSKSLINIFKIGTSAGGVNPKILISEHKKSGEIIPGDLEYSDNYHHYIIKLALDEEAVYPREIVEYCYNLTAAEIGIEVMDSKLIENRHFATLRYDRQLGEKQHCLTATGITGWDFRSSTNSNYERLFKLSSFLKIKHTQTEELFKRMVFNVIFQNNDDHLKNHSFIYNKKKDRWKLSPAYDLTYSTNPLLVFKKNIRALAINRKRIDINLDDILKIANEYTIKNPKGIIEEVQDAIPFLRRKLKEHEVSEQVITKMFAKIKAIK